MTERYTKPIGFSKEEHGSSSLSCVNGDSKCPKCGEGHVFPPSGYGDWGSPSSAATAYCTECSTSFKLMLVAQEE